MNVFRYSYHEFDPGSCPATMRFNGVYALCCFSVLCAVAPLQAAVRVLFLPFEDKVKLNEAWDLAVDVPRWFSQTIDTIASHDTLVRTVPFDTVNAFIVRSGWRRAEYLSVEKMQRLAAMYNADIVATGTVKKFVVVKRGLSGDGKVDGSSAFSSSTSGGSDITVSAGLQSYTANIRMTVMLYNGRTGAVLDTVPLEATEKDGGLKVWLPVKPDNDELNFYYLSRTPFGSSYFHRSVVGAVMKSYSQKIRAAVIGHTIQAPPAPAAPRQYLQGKVLEQVGKDLYLNLGSADNLVPGDTLEVLRPQKPIVQGSDTLGWTETPVATAAVRLVKSSHFSQATIIGGQDSVAAGWTARMKMAP